MSGLRRRALLLTAAVLFAIGAAFGTEFALSLRPDRPFGHTAAGHLMG